ncbi:MAG: rhomboid family intramembrane serine protease [Chthoniobacterales bacterium]|nr:rhomboid family intramembrane serine protease [Chthoniobacterales bacterium]MDQ3119049.1 rhomboid family intramembrane serine protease [Verrucomicrobiota bacterium]
MYGVTTSDDYQPVTWVGRYPVHVTTLLVALHSVAAVFACFVPSFFNALMFDSAAVLNGAVWQIATYAFVHPPSGLLWFAIEMYMLFMFGQEVERYIGRRAFITLYLLLLLAPTLLLTLWGLSERTGLAGSSGLHFAVFVAFATIFPRVEMFLRILAKWVALVLGAILTLQLFAARAWPELAVLWLSIGGAFLFIRLRGIGPELEWLTALKDKLQPKPKFKVVPRSSPRRVVEPENVYESIDPLLEKISKSGINSLTANERRALDRARNQLLKKSP